MNGRIHGEDTPEGRLAAVAKSLMVQMEERFKQTRVGSREPDYADFRDAFRPFMQREVLLARIDEARKSHSMAITARVAELGRELEALNKSMPDEFRL